MPKVSVIIPTYNRANYICEAVDSILNQTYQNFEIIVIDDGSIDNTKEVLSKYKNKIQYFYKNNEGAASARNFGVNKASGEYIAFLDSDDYWLRDKLEIQLKIFNFHSDVDLIYGLAKQIDKNGRTIDLKPSQPALVPIDFLENKRISMMTVILKKSCFESIGLFDKRIKACEDTDMWLRFSFKYKIFFLNKILAVARFHGENISNNAEEMYINELKIIDKLLNKEIENNFSKRLIENLKAINLYKLSAVYFHKNENFKLSFCTTIKSLRINFLVGKNFINKNDSLLFRFKKIFNPYAILVLSLLKSCLPKRTNRDEVKKILFYEPSSGFGGSASSLACLINNLNRKKFYPILAIKNYGPQIDKIKDAEIIKFKDYIEQEKLSCLSFFIYFIKNIIPEVIKIWFIIKHKKVHLMHINTNIISGIPAIFASKIARVPCVCYIRQTKKLIRREKIIIKLANKIVIINRKAFEIYREDVYEDKLNIIYDGIDLCGYFQIERGNFRKELNLDSMPIVGLVGRIVKGKGQKEFILAAKEVLKVKPDVRFLIVGDAKGDSDYYYKEVRELVKKEDLSKNIIFTGWRSDVINVISDLDILVQASTIFPEGMPNILIEAMALRKPIVATDIPGSSEIVIEGVTGFMVRPEDIKAMAEKIIFLLGNPNVAKEMGEKGRRRAEELFDIRKTVMKLEGIYEEVLNKK